MPATGCQFLPTIKTGLAKNFGKLEEGTRKETVNSAQRHVPQLLRSLTEALSGNGPANVRSGFQKCGIVPLDRKKVLDQLPDETNTDTNPSTSSVVTTSLDDSFKSLLQSMRYDDAPKPKRKKKVDVQPGKSLPAR